MTARVKNVHLTAVLEGILGAGTPGLPERYCAWRRFLYFSVHGIEIDLSKHLKIFTLFPLGDFRLEALNFGILDEDVVVDELFAKCTAEEGIVL